MKPDSELLAWFGLSRTDSNWRSDWREIANCFIKSDIRYLYHFTDRANVPSILDHGLISKSEIARRDLSSRMSSNPLSRELDHKKGTYNYVFLSFREDTPMLYDKLNHGIEAVILRVNSSAAFEKGVKWCDSNSTKNNSNISDSINDLERFDFSSILSVKKYWANPLEKDRRQAEILVPSIVAPALITAWRSPERKNSWQTINAQPQSTSFKAADRTPTTQTNSPTKAKRQASVTPKVQQKPKATHKPIPRPNPTPAKKRHSNRPKNKTQLFTPTTKPRATRNTNKTMGSSSTRNTPTDSDRQIAAANDYGLLVVCLMAAIIPALVLISSRNKRELDPKETQDSVVVDPSKWYMGDVKPKDTSSPSDSSNPSNARSPMAQTAPKKPRTPISSAEPPAPPIPPVLSGDVITLIHDSKPPLRFRLVKSLNLYVAETELTNSQIRQITGEHYSDDNKPFTLGSLWKQDNFIPSLTLKASSLLKDRLESVGYDLRLPTLEEWEQYSNVKQLSSSNVDLSKYAVHSMNSGRNTAQTLKPSFKKWESMRKSEGRFLSQYKWTKHLRNNDCKPQQVKSKLPNQYGLYDCIGNVAELLPARTIDGNPRYSKVVGSYATPPEFLSRPKQPYMSFSEAPCGSAFKDEDWYFKDAGIRFVIEIK